MEKFTELFQNGLNGVHNKKGSCFALTYTSDPKESAVMICRAINSTYGEGINPKAVVDLLEAVRVAQYHLLGITVATKDKVLSKTEIIKMLNDALLKADEE